MASFLRAKEWNANGCSLKWAILSERGENGKSKWVKEQPTLLFYVSASQNQGWEFALLLFFKVRGERITPVTFYIKSNESDLLPSLPSHFLQREMGENVSLK